MYGISRLQYFGTSGDVFADHFAPGINYVQGANDTGKTEFYKFLDYMLGNKDMDPSRAYWFKGTLDAAELTIDRGSETIAAYRSIDGSELRITRNGTVVPCQDIDEYREVIGDFLCIDERAFRRFRTYVGENMSYRSFLVFNLFGEGGQGKISDFFDKSRVERYRVKLPKLLDCFFNGHVEEICELQHNQDEIKRELAELEREADASELLLDMINEKLSLLLSDYRFDGRNIQKLDKVIASIREPVTRRSKTEDSIALEFALEDVASRINQLSKEINDANERVRQESSRKVLLERLSELIEGHPEFEELAESTLGLLGELKTSESLMQFDMRKDALDRARREHKRLKAQIDSMPSAREEITRDGREAAIAVLEDARARYSVVDEDRVNELKEKVRQLSTKERELRQDDDRAKLERLSARISSLYKSACGRSRVADDDFSHTGFGVEFSKGGCMLQSYVFDSREEGRKVAYAQGSFARHTLVQLCGYVAFLEMLANDRAYPIIPTLIVDHISKPFSEENAHGIGAILSSVTHAPMDIQVIIFDSREPGELGIEPAQLIHLEDGGRTGFNPFYHASRMVL